jgi:2-polyprenyl-3-methyl-5-hydroxy-6-metoxy-1,4-benzoquinol methylase
VPETVDALTQQDTVIASNFLCHMPSPTAETCLRNIGRLVRPHGYLFVSGIDLDVRTKVADELGWSPLQELLEEIHEGDFCMKTFWPWHYAGLEPLNKKRRDWKRRYAATFQVLPREKNTSDRIRFGVSPNVAAATKSLRKATI